MENAIQLWSDPSKTAEIKKLFAPTLTDTEFQIFMGIGKATKTNPFLKEIWAVKYGGKQASIFIGRDGYRKSAQAHEDYDYHIADAVYSLDKFTVKNGEIEHEYTFPDRGVLVGAYCTVKRKSSSKPSFVYVDLKEYKGSDGSLWSSKPATMIKKVAEAQALRMTFQELFSGTYDESEELEKDEPKEIKVEKEIYTREMMDRDAMTWRQRIIDGHSAESLLKQVEVKYILSDEVREAVQFLTPENVDSVFPAPKTK